MLESGTFDSESHDPWTLVKPIHDGLLDAEKRKLAPLIDELRANSQQAWHARISREMAQLSEADWRAKEEGKQPDPRWVRMKNSLISRLHEGLANRLKELDKIRDDLSTKLEIRVAIRLE